MNTSALLLLEAAGRMFAYLFGHGAKGMLRRDAVELDFGLRVALNTVDPDKLRSVDVELTVHTRRDLSRVSSMDTFGIDISRDLLRAVTGIPRDQDLARRLSGSDTLSFATYVEFPRLAEKSVEMLQQYSADQYKEHFAWIDHLRPATDPSLIQELDSRLTAAIVGARSSQPHLAPPEPIDWEPVEGFTFSTESTDEIPHVDLDLDDYLLSLQGNEPSLAKFSSDRVQLRHTDILRPVQEWSVYECLVFETELGDSLYVLTRGRWFQIARLFTNRVRNEAASLPQARISLMEAEEDEDEPHYNARMAAQDGVLLMDRKTLSAREATSGIEFCDLLTRNSELVHVKKWSKSATLSHLFAQGTVSAETLLADRAFREALRDLIASTNPEYVDLIPLSRPNPSSYSVVYVVIGKPEGAGALPFFSQLALVQAASRLRILGFEVGTGFVAIAAS